MFMFVLKVFEIIINILKSKEEDLKAKVLEKMNVENLNEIVLIPKDAEVAFNEDSFARSDSLFIKFSEVYELHKVLGVGSYGVVAEVTELATHRKIAIKMCQYNPLEMSQSALTLEREYSLMKDLSHPNIIKVFKTEQKYLNYFILEMEMGFETL